MSSIKEIKKIGGPFKGNLLVKNCDRGIASNSKAYLNIVFQDVTGVLDAKKWEIIPGDMDILVPGKIVFVDGEVFSYRGNMQMKVLSVASVDQESVDINEFMSGSPVDVEALKAELEKYLSSIANTDIQRITRFLIEDNYLTYTTYPAAMTFHHSYYGGILFHSLSIAKLADQLASDYPFLSRDYLIAGSLLHDLGKTIELSGNIATNYTTPGRLLGHINIGANLINNAAQKLGISGEVPIVLEHLILSHHGLPEFGSAVTPRTAEAFILHELDDIDSKMNMLEAALSGVDEGGFTTKLLGFDGRQFYKVHK